MATPHLCTKKEQYASNQRLLGTGSHLLIITKKTAWTNKDLIITPDMENYSMAASYGTTTEYSYRPSSRFADGWTMANRLAAIRDRKTVASWHAGHKPLYSYMARSFGPWRIKTDKDVYVNNSISDLEFGANWLALRFNFRALPIGMASAFTPYLRIWNPSCVHDADSNPAFDGGTLHNTYLYTQGYNNTGHVLYHFDDELMPPNQHMISGCGDIDFAAHCNEGKGGGQGWQPCKDYDIYGAHLQVASSTSHYNMQHTRIYRKSSSDNSAYFADVPITGNGLELLKKCIPKGKVWLHLGFVIGDMSWQSGIQNGMLPYSTYLLYASRVELYFRITMPRFNY